MKRIKRTKDPGTRDTGGKAKGYSPSESNNIAVHLSISLNNYSKYIINILSILSIIVEKDKD